MWWGQAWCFNACSQQSYSQDQYSTKQQVLKEREFLLNKRHKGHQQIWKVKSIHFCVFIKVNNTQRFKKSLLRRDSVCPSHSSILLTQENKSLVSAVWHCLEERDWVLWEGIGQFTDYDHKMNLVWHFDMFFVQDQRDIFLTFSL